MELKRKLEILADAVKYDASCAPSGTDKRTPTDGKGIGSTTVILQQQSAKLASP